MVFKEDEKQSLCHGDGEKKAPDFAKKSGSYSASQIQGETTI